ncbi:hypothetical protein ACFLQ4_01665 [Bacteroidota bacterium]
MKALIVIFSIIGLLAAGCTTTYLNLKDNSTAQIEEKIIDYQTDKDVGVNVVLLVKSGKEISGELLSVRESALIICTEHSATEQELASLKFPINTIQNDEIKELTIEGSNYILLGLGIGVVACTGIGLLLGLASDPSNNAIISPELALGFLGFLVGLVAGPTVGYFLSTDDIILQEIPPGYDFSFLKPLSRYPDEEPEYLKAIE